MHCNASISAGRRNCCASRAVRPSPLPEEMDKLNGIPVAVKHLQRDIGNIMRLIELYGKRDVEFKTRYKSRTDLSGKNKIKTNLGFFYHGEVGVTAQKVDNWVSKNNKNIPESR